MALKLTAAGLKAIAVNKETAAPEAIGCATDACESNTKAVIGGEAANVMTHSLRLGTSKIFALAGHAFLASRLCRGGSSSLTFQTVAAERG